jgi:hypothetical protein
LFVNLVVTPSSPSFPKSRSGYEFNPSPDPSLFFFNVHKTVPYFYVLLKGVFTSLGQDSDLLPAHHGGRQLLPLTLACGTTAPQPSAQVSSPHHGRRRLRLVGDQSTGGVSGEYHHQQRECVTRALLMVHLICLVACHILPAIIHLPPSNYRERRQCNNQPVRRDERGMARRERGGGNAAREVVIQQLAGAREMVAQGKRR